MYVINLQGDDLDDSPFDGDQSLITRRHIYCINHDIVERMNNGSIVDVYVNQL